MKILVDTCIWSLALRRSKKPPGYLVDELADLISEFRIQMIGPIRQELLSGIKAKKQFDRLKDTISAFPDLSLQTRDYELAAEFFNTARQNGIRGSSTDFLICAVSSRYNMPIFTTDKDFISFSQILPISLYQPRLKPGKDPGARKNQ